MIPSFIWVQQPDEACIKNPLPETTTRDQDNEYRFRSGQSSISLAMAATTSNAGQHMMSASLGPEDHIDYFENPYTALEKLQDAWRNKEHDAPWSTEKMDEVDVEGVDWHKYEPPTLLLKAPNVTSQILLEIVSASIENVKTRVADEDRLKCEAEEEAARRAAEEYEKGKGVEPYLPIIITPPQIPPPEPSTKITTTPIAPDLTLDAILAGTHTESSIGKDKRRKFDLRRIFQRNPERGESSASGRAREALRQKFEANLSSIDFGSADPRTQEAIEALKKNRLFKAAESNELVECVSCLDDIPVKDVVKVPCHSYCRDCFVRLITASVQNEQQWPPKCCLNQIPFKTVLKNIPDDLKKTFHERASEWDIPISERVYCHVPGCGLWVKPSKISLSKRQARCDQGHLTCTFCRGQSHGKEECPQDQDLNLTNMLAEEEGWKRCYSCHAFVEHKEACQHMTCRCGAEFCYVCGLQWRTCGCTMQQLQAIKDAADTRRQQRQVREQADAAELRDILAQIEEFERQEAWRLELERQELERLEEERWQAEVKERIRLEHIRRRDIEAKYHLLRQMLDELHELQQVMIESKQDDDAKTVVEEAKKKREELERSQEIERSDLDSLLLVKLRTKEDKFAKEHAARIAVECEMEEEYQQQLRDFWYDKTDAFEEKIEAGMLPLRQRLDLAYRHWQKWRNEQLELYRTKLEDERTLKEELMYSTKKRMEAAHVDEETELTRRMVADKKWIQEVILERERLLGGYEVQEMEGDADSLFTPENIVNAEAD